MDAYGLKGTIDKIRHANGPAQHIACAMCGLIMAGMFVGQVSTALICIWGSLSVAVIFATVWLPRTLLKYTLLVDFVFSMIVLFQYTMYEAPTALPPIYHVNGVNGMEAVVLPSYTHHMSAVDEIFHSAALVWLAAWSLYLANLVHRQILEHKRFTE